MSSDSCLARHSKPTANTPQIHLINYSSPPQEAHSCIFQMVLLKLYFSHNKKVLTAKFYVSFITISLVVFFLRI